MNNNLKLSTRLVRSYSFVFAVLLLITMIISYVYITHTGKQIAMLNQKELADQAIKRIESYLIDLDNKSYQVMTDSRILNIFGKIKDDNSSDNYFDTNILTTIDTGSVLTSINGPTMPIWRISVYNQYGDYISSGAISEQKQINKILNSSNIGEEMTSLLYLPDKLEIKNPQKDIWSNVYSSNYVTAKRPLMNIYSKEVLGIVEVQQDINVLTESLGFENLKNVQVKVYDGEGNQILPLVPTDGSKKKLYSSNAVSKKYGWKVELGQTEKALLSPYQPIIIMLGIGSVVVLMIIVLIAQLIAQRISKPLVLLAKTVGKININTIPDTLSINDSIDEVNSLKEAFALMINRINNSISHERRAWLLALQSQMNPHFLYNMLSVISSAALENGNDKVVGMCNRMSSMFRYVANYDETTVTVQAELDHVKNYLELMKERYEDFFNFDIIADDKIKQMLIPKLVMQPLAENCFMHGFKNIEPPYYIKVEAIATESNWIIRVIDNGSGIISEKKESILKNIEQYQNSLPQDYSNMKIGGMGLVSSILRFRLQASKFIDYSIEDNMPNGTIISIRGELI